ncbi:MAG: hypothetical protein HY962_12090 [Ignavibacteriae bacterium]|nr:hypothetical protein [Ignavibacteriota bacterium]
MNTMNMERLIEKYFDGALSPAERLDFERLAAGDPALMRSIQAEGSIREVFARDRARMHTDSGALQTHLAGMLKQVPGTPASLPAAGGASTWLGAAATIKITSIAVAVLGILGATYFLTPDPGPADSLRATTEETVAPAAAAPAPAQAPVENTVTGATRNDAGGRTSAVRPEDEIRVLETDQVRDAGTGVATGSAVMTSDTVRTRVNVNLNPIKKDENI